MAVLGKVRIDKWLWSVRVYKTRTLATKSCDQGKVKVGEINVKASYKVKVGDVLIAKTNPLKKTLKVLQLIEKRVGAEIAQACYEDISPEEDKIIHNSLKNAFLLPNAYRDKGDGRPTKRDRRTIDKFKDIDLNE
ncbi:MAG: ribosome-associated heat shock protein Hsp15 [Planctomycetota bacterium]|jgi:ribosome-associated heat shock protein Hsp15